MKSRRDCDCPCHSGSVLVHVVPCCDGFIGYFKKELTADGIKKPAKKPKRKKSK